MFVVFNTVKPVSGPINRRRQKKYLSSCGLRTVRNDKCLPFCILDVLDEKRGIDWKNVFDNCGRYASRIVAPRNLILPDEDGLKRFVPLSMNSLLTFNTAKNIIEKSELPPDKFSITLTDRNGIYPSKVHELLPLSSQIRIVTAFPERYSIACANALNEHGASLIIRPSYEETSKPDAVICTDGTVTSSMKNAAVFTNKRKTGGKLLFSGSGIGLLPEHLDIIPTDIDPIDFAGALTELCGYTGYKNSVFSEISIGCSQCADMSPEKCFQSFVNE